MDAFNPVHTEKAECQDCYKCLRECTVKAIKISQGRAAIVPERCVLCGHCVEVCPVGAKKVRKDLPRVRSLLASGKKVIASLAPSFVSEFPGLRTDVIIASLKKLGFAEVCETALGADIVSRRIAHDLSLMVADAGAGSRAEGRAGSEGGAPSAGRGKFVISSACPTVVEYIMKYYPEFSSGIVPFHSPLLAQARFLRDFYGEETGVVFIGPCIAKKHESDLHRELVDASIDFHDIREWFADACIDPAEEPGGPDQVFRPARAGKGALYPVDGGMIAAIKAWDPPRGISFMSFSGLKEIDRALGELEADGGAGMDGPVFLELLACEGGCVNGPRCATRKGTITKRLKVLGYARDAGGDNLPGDTEISNRYSVIPVCGSTFSDAELEAVLRRTGKYSRTDELNCGGCGYDCCRDFARAVLENKAEAAMCVSYMRKLAQKKANGLFRAIPSGVVIVDRDLRIVECNRNFARLMDEETAALWDLKPGLEGAELEKTAVFHKLFADVLAGADSVDRDIHIGNRILHGAVFAIESGNLAGGVFQDVTIPWVRKDRIVNQSRKVIEKNLAVVQKIAYLLGENAAETETILNSIIESFDGEEGQDGRGPGQGRKKTRRDSAV